MQESIKKGSEELVRKVSKISGEKVGKCDCKESIKELGKKVC